VLAAGRHLRADLRLEGPGRLDERARCARVAHVVQAVVHGVVFAVLNYFLYKFLEPMMRERFENPPTEVAPPCQKGYKSCPSGDCIPANDPHETCPGSTDAY